MEKEVSYGKVFKALKRKEKVSKFQQRRIFSFNNVKVLSLARQTLESLPGHSDYLLEHETDYGRKMAEVLPLFANIRLEQIEYVVSEATFKKLLVQLTRQTDYK
jgi:hypothetical protein